MTMTSSRSQLSITPLGGALGAVVEGLNVAVLDDDALREVAAELTAAWDRHLVLFFPGANLSPADQVRFARCFGSRSASTTETGGDYRNAPSLADEGFPEILLLDSADPRFRPAVTAVWHTDVTFTEQPPIASLFAMEIATQSGGNTMWSNQIKAHAALSAPIRDLIGQLAATHGRPPLTGTASHPMVKDHHATGERALFVNRGWTKSIDGLHGNESEHLLAAIYETAERPEMQIRWTWTSGDAALWDNRYTMHYALNDYAGQRRRARRATIYAD
jgi:alpha-ketoglutarate-dependent taurine dioxygenase